MDSKSSCTKMHFQSHVLGTVGSAPLRLCTCMFVYEGFDQNHRAPRSLQQLLPLLSDRALMITKQVNKKTSNQ